jgi:AcrR family transcriptional regulator
MTTKQRLLEEALTLFSERGYDGTGVDLIAERAGIRGSSLYRHFKGKEEVLNTLIDITEERYDEYWGSCVDTETYPRSRQEFIRITLDRFKFMMSDPIIKKIRIFFVREQFRNERLAEVANRQQMDGLLEMYGEIISSMMKEGLFTKNDPASLAIELVSPAVLLIAKVDRQPEYEKKALEAMEEHVQRFCDRYMI